MGKGCVGLTDQGQDFVYSKGDMEAINGLSSEVIRPDILHTHMLTHTHTHVYIHAHTKILKFTEKLKV